MVELEEFINIRSSIEAVYEVVGVWEFSIKDCDRPLRIKVVKSYPSNPNYPYTGYANLKIQNPDQASPYRAIHPRSSIQDAIRTALSGFLGYWNPERVKETKLVEVDDW